MRRRLILNADDFGLTPGINRSIVDAFCRGVLTSTTLMANAPATQEAIELAHAHTKLGVGCHVVLIDGAPLADPAHLDSLVPQGTSEFRTSLGGFAGRAIAGRLDRDQIEAEASAQFRHLLAENLPLTHLDTHKHAHMFPLVLEGLLRAARTCGIPAIRNPFEPAARIGRAGWLRKRSLQTRTLRMLQPRFRELVKRSGLRTTDGTVGIAETGTLNADAFARIVADLPAGTWEFVFHPGYLDDDLRAANTRLRESRQVELELLTAPETGERLKHAGIELISYADL